MTAEKALIDKNRYTILPEGINDVTAAALPNAVLGADLALRYRAYMEKGKTRLLALDGISICWNIDNEKGMTVDKRRVCYGKIYRSESPISNFVV